MRERGLSAADYDEQHGTRLADRTRTRGDCVTLGGARHPGELLYRACDFGPGVSAAALDERRTKTRKLLSHDKCENG